MRYLKTVCMVFAADILALFVSFTLAGSSAAAVRAVSAVCGAGILAVILVNHAVSEAKNDLKEKRMGGLRTAFLMGASASAPCLASWAVLMLSVRVGFQFYPAHKLINGFFIQLLNLIEPDASSAALSAGEVWLMLPLALIPAAAVITAYTLTEKGLIFSGK